MRLKRIIDSDSEEFKQIWSIYEFSFPQDERRDLGQQTKLLDNEIYNLFAGYDEDQLVGFIATWEFDDFIFIEHFAIEESLRGKGLGTKILSEYLGNNNKKVVLETERSEEGDIAVRRIEFYKRLGFKLNTHDYIQPPYDEGKKPVPLFLMTRPREINKSEFVEVREQLHKIVYGLKTPLLADQN